MQIIPRKNDTLHKGGSTSGNAVTLRDAVNQLFDESFWDPWHLWNTRLPQIMDRVQSGFVPDVDVSENEKRITVTADVPGIDPKDVDVSVDDNVLTIQGTVREENEEKDEEQKWYRKECSQGSFLQRFTLPEYADVEKIQCKAKNGKLRIHIPKKQQKKSSAKKIPIES